MNDIEQQLATLTEWTGGATSLWQKAEPRKPGAVARLLPKLSRRLSNKFLVISGIAAVLMIAVFTSIPRVGTTTLYEIDDRSSLKLAVPAERSLDGEHINVKTMAEGIVSDVGPPAKEAISSIGYTSSPTQSDVVAYSITYDQAQSSSPSDARDPNLGRSRKSDYWARVQSSGVAPQKFNNSSTSNVPDPATDTSSQYPPARRFVIHNGTVELLSSDVSAAFMKVQQLVRAEAGEFVENSSLSGDAQNAQANLTLRVTADRLDDVLNELRKIGKVESEQLGGRDVTTEVVDVDARLRNEKRVETELLELLESRKDAPLNELMQLRESLKNVRYSIESLAGRRETLSRMVSLATLLVIIRTDAKPPAPLADSFWSYFGREIDTAWTAAIRFLADAAATIVRILVGGLPFWIGLAVLMVVLRKRKA